MQRLLTAAALTAAILPASAAAAAPWSDPAPLTGAVFYSAGLVTTPAGTTVLSTDAKPTAFIYAPTLTATVAADGQTTGPRQQLAIAGALPVPYGKDRVALIGLRLPTSIATARSAPVVVSTGLPGSFGAPRTLPGTAAQRLLAAAGSPAGLLAFVTGTVTGHRERIVWLRKGGVTRKVLTIPVSTQGRGASIAVGSHGDLLVAWEDHHLIYTRHIGPTGRVQAKHWVGDGVQSAIQTRFDESGRQEVAWETQRLAEGYAVTGAKTYYTSAQRGHGFTKPKLIGRSDLTGSGRYVSSPGVRLVGSGSDSSVLAFTVYDGSHFRVQQANAVGGTVQAPVTLSPPGVDAVLGDLAYARLGGTLVLWRTGTRGADASGDQQVFASVRPGGFPDFAAPEPIGASGAIPSAPSAAVNAKTGQSIAAYGYLTPSVQVSVRAAG